MGGRFHSNRGVTSLQVGVVISLLFLLSFIVAFFLGREGSSLVVTEFGRFAEKTRLVQTMRSELLASSEAEKSSVMADTDEASIAFAEQSMQASQKVEKARTDMEPLVERGSKEEKMFNEFSSCWKRLQEIDREVLSLAVQNTNLKALRLSLVPASNAIRRMEEPLGQLMNSMEAPHTAAIMRFAFEALTGTLNIYALQAPHIAETSDAGMDRIEAEMNRFDVQVREALRQLDEGVEVSSKPFVGRTWKAYQDFQKINAEIVALSRRNSNIRSSEISLGRKRNTMAECLDLLNGLQDAVREGATFKATK